MPDRVPPCIAKGNVTNASRCACDWPEVRYHKWRGSWACGRPPSRRCARGTGAQAASNNSSRANCRPHQPNSGRIAMALRTSARRAWLRHVLQEVRRPEPTFTNSPEPRAQKRPTSCRRQPFEIAMSSDSRRQHSHSLHPMLSTAQPCSRVRVTVGCARLIRTRMRTLHGPEEPVPAAAHHRSVQP